MVSDSLVLEANAFLRQPSDIDAQLALAETTLKADRAEIALQVLRVELPGAEDKIHRRLLLRLTALDAVGKVKEADAIGRQLLFSQYVRAPILVWYGLRSIEAEKHDDAVQFFILALEKRVFAVDVHDAVIRQAVVPDHVVAAILGRFKKYLPLIAPIKSALLEAFFRCDSVGAQFFARDYVFGPKTDSLSSSTERMIETLLTEQWHLFETQQLEMPESYRIFAAGAGVPTSGKRILIFLERLIGLKGGKEIEHSVPRCLRKTAEDAGIDVKIVDCSAIVQVGNDAQTMASIEQEIRHFKPDVVMTSPDDIWGLKTPIVQRLIQLRQKHGFKIAAFSSDPHVMNPVLSSLDQWIHYVDLVIAVPNHSVTTAPLVEADKLLNMALPVSGSDVELSRHVEKDLDFVFLGRRTSVRHFMVDPLLSIFDNNYIEYFNKMGAEQWLDSEAYWTLTARSKYTISATFDGPVEVSRGRVWEAVMCGVLLFNLGRKLTDFYLIPFIHYIPVSNRDQLVQFARFFKKHPEWRDRIAAEGQTLYANEYAPTAHWGAVFKKLGLTDN